MEAQVQHYQHKLAYELDSADLYDAVNSGEPIVIIDARKKEAYDAEHIPGAVSFGHRLMNEESTRGLDKSKLYVTYCDGIGCNGSTKGALKLSQLGFQVKELMGGLDWWKRDGYATEGTSVERPLSVAGEITCTC
ncbi:rhodanese-like domain-containing protein [Hymenobacter cellulosilyticus]|uniref:Rhodanese-like domain-containing protein n=1 Tax=Hymenobacter cellulosilyticus TaxID=2932248 RepID=A0A8T9Q6J7_9BACT|nr:rhodanese-like domain-containing protein [Hymenobacter cellulosilyticus]UOQ72735.1 rhodanese-like domain-containing protein [Hymenobacter cellulosilyticus]